MIDGNAMWNRPIYSGLLLAGALACGGADHAQAVTGTAATTPVGMSAAQRTDAIVVDKLSEARCAREETCHNVGNGLEYASRDTCSQAMRGSLGNDLNSYNCPRGINNAALDSCEAAIRDESCGHPLDTIQRLEKCRTGNLCMN
jgi:Family of unknown function (DUF6184)